MNMSDQFHVPAILPPRKNPRQSFEGTLSVLQGRSGRFGEEENFLLLEVFK